MLNLNVQWRNFVESTNIFQENVTLFLWKVSRPDKICIKPRTIQIEKMQNPHFTLILSCLTAVTDELFEVHKCR